MGLEDILALVGVVLGIVIPLFFKFDDKADQILNSIILTKTSILAEFIDKVENRIRNNLVYDDNMSTSFSVFIKQMSISFDNKKGIENYIHKCSKYTSKLIHSAISIFIFTALKYLFVLCCKYGDEGIQERYLDIFNGVIIINFIYLVFCIYRIWNAYTGFRSLSINIKKQADLIV